MGTLSDGDPRPALRLNDATNCGKDCAKIDTALKSLEDRFLVQPWKTPRPNPAYRSIRICTGEPATIVRSRSRDFAPSAAHRLRRTEVLREMRHDLGEPSGAIVPTRLPDPAPEENVPKVAGSKSLDIYAHRTIPRG